MNLQNVDVEAEYRYESSDESSDEDSDDEESDKKHLNTIAVI